MMDVRSRLDMLRMQLNWIEREMWLLRQAVGEPMPHDTPARTFESLRGIWEDVAFDEEDIQASRLTLPKEL